MPKHENMDQYIQDCEPAIIPLLKELRAFINETLPGTTEGMKYGAPYFYNANGAAVIYLFGSNDHVNFGFLKVTEMDDAGGILKGSGKPSKHIKIYLDQPIDKPMLRQFIKQCEGMTP